MDSKESGRVSAGLRSQYTLHAQDALQTHPGKDAEQNAVQSLLQGHRHLQGCGDYPGAHEPLVDEYTFDRIQAIPESRVNGERTNKHPHFLKGTVYCAYCESRLSITNAKKSKDGSVYPYFFCLSRHNKKCPDCKSRYVLIPEVERKIKQLSDNLHDSLELLDNCGTFYRNASDTMKRLMNQAIFEKIYISCSKGVPLEIEAKYNPPLNVILQPFIDEIAQINRLVRQSADVTIEKIEAAKNRILKHMRYGLSASCVSADMESYPKSNFFTDKISNKELLVERSNVYPNIVTATSHFYIIDNGRIIIAVISI